MSIFIGNKYTRWYYSIITNARLNPSNGYSEKHHIIPKSLGGTNSKENLISLTARQHFVCHQLLTKMTCGTAKHKMLCALTMMMRKNDNQQRHCISSKAYELIRTEWAEAHSKLMQSDEMKEQIRQKLKGRKVPAEVIEKRKGQTPWNKGLTLSNTHCQNLSVAHLGNTHTLETRKSMSKTRTGMNKSAEHRLALSKSAIGRINSEEHKQKIRDTLKSKSKVECPKCGKILLDVGANFNRHVTSCINTQSSRR